MCSLPPSPAGFKELRSVGLSLPLGQRSLGRVARPKVKVTALQSNRVPTLCLSGRMYLFYGNKTSVQFAGFTTTVSYPGELQSHILFVLSCSCMFTNQYTSDNWDTACDSTSPRNKSVSADKLQMSLAHFLTVHLRALKHVRRPPASLAEGLTYSLGSVSGALSSCPLDTTAPAFMCSTEESVCVWLSGDMCTSIGNLESSAVLRTCEWCSPF